MLVVWAGLLGLALPALACASPGHDCCPHDSQSPCGGNHPSAPVQSGNACCTDAPAVTRVPTAQAIRVRLAPNDFAHLPPAFGTPACAWVTSQSQRVPRRSIHTVSVYYPDASLTYLRTARLRL